jgi:hypothetical protein
VGRDFIEDFGGAILDGTHDTEQHAAGDTAPGAMASPCLAFEGLRAFDLTRAQRACGEAGALGFAPPARAGQREAPQDRFIFVEQNDVAPARLVLQGRECDRARGEVGRGGVEPPGGAVVAYILFFKAQRTLSRPS